MAIIKTCSYTMIIIKLKLGDNKMKNLFLLVCVSLILNLYANEKITFESDPSPPFIIGKMGTVPTGISIDIVNEIFSRIEGVEGNYKDSKPWKRVLRNVEQGETDAIFPILKNDERAKKYFYSDKIIPAETSFFFLKEKFPNGFKFETLKDLNNKKICVLAGYAVHKYLEKKQEEQDLRYRIVTAFGSEEKCLRLLKEGRIDIYAANKSTGFFQLNEFGLNSKFIDVANKPIYSKNYYIAFSKNTKAHKWIPKINEIIKLMKKDGSIDKILYSK